MKKWDIINKFRIQNSEFRIKELVKILLENRGIKTKNEIENFLNPKLENVNAKNAKIDLKQLKKAIERIKKAIDDKEKIVVYGDYDVDGVCATAILWETLHSIGADVSPYIPHRIEEGYGLSIKGIQNILAKRSHLDTRCDLNKTKLIITVDNGIVANEAVKFAKERGIDVIITDHHVPPEKLPGAYSIIHTTKLCGAGVAYLLSQEIKDVILNEVKNLTSSLEQQTRSFASAQDDIVRDNHLELVALATIADMVPLLGANRTLVKFGLEALKETKRAGLLELFKEAAVDKSLIGVYEVGHIISPRLNAMGRLEFAMDSLRLLCTKDRMRAFVLAEKLGRTNKERQELTLETAIHAKENSKFKIQNSKLLFIAHETYQPGVIGLVAGKLVDEFYRPAIVVSISEKYSKASARSISGFNIIEFIRSASEHLVDCGGHPMAAGFTVETNKIALLQAVLEKKAHEILDDEKLKRVLKIDCEIPLSIADQELYDEIQKLSPFGMGNPEPTFMSKSLVIEDMRLVGQDRRHLKLKFRIQKNRHAEFNSVSKKILKPVQDDINGHSGFKVFDAIAFGMGDRVKEFHIRDTVDVVFTISENVWNGNRDLQLKIRDIKIS